MCVRVCVCACKSRHLVLIFNTPNRWSYSARSGQSLSHTLLKMLCKPWKKGVQAVCKCGNDCFKHYCIFKNTIFKNNVSKWRPGSLHSFGQFSTLLKRSLLLIDLLAIFLSSARFQQHGRHSKKLVFKWIVKVSKISLSTWANGYIMNVALFFDFGFHCHLPEPTNSACPISLI